MDVRACIFDIFGTTVDWRTSVSRDLAVFAQQKGIGGIDCTIYEDRSRPNYFMEVFRFKDEAEFAAFDDKFHKDRKIAAIYALLDDIVEAEKSDFKIFERRL